LVAVPALSRVTYEALNVPPEFYARHWVALQVLPWVAVGVANVLVIGSILLLLRKRASRATLLSWCLLKIGYAVGQLFFVLPIQKEVTPLQLKVMLADQAANSPVKMDLQTLETMGSTALAAGVTWLCALPIFFLIWFLRPKIRFEMSGWSK
jgi:hypothetical protein